MRKPNEYKQKLTHTIQVKVDYIMKSKFYNAANKKGMSTSCWLRNIGLLEIEGGLPEPKQAENLPQPICDVQPFKNIGVFKYCRTCDLQFQAKDENEIVCSECVYLEEMRKK